jgi:uncharacterized protein DUF397
MRGKGTGRAMHSNDLVSVTWRKSSYSGNSGNCVEVATKLPGVVAIRDSKDPNGSVLAVNRAAWREFTDALSDQVARRV